ncbi:MAG: AIPR family protein [Candidatus Saccharimonadales bacterium]
MENTINLMVQDIKRLVTPIDDIFANERGAEGRPVRTYVAVVSLKDVPKELEDWRRVNVRDSATGSGVAKSIARSLRDDPQAFFYKNRGLTIIAKDIEFPKTKDNTVRIVFDNPEYNGLLDGGHTYTMIQKHLSGLSEAEKQGLDGYVRVEVIVGVRHEEDIVSIVEARNTSMQVRLQSTQELAGYFDPIKQALKGMPYADKIAYKEIELADDYKQKPIDVKDILGYLVCIDAERYPATGKEQPTKAYSSKASVVKMYDDPAYRKKLERYMPILTDVLNLHDKIYEDLPIVHNKALGGRFGKVKGISGDFNGKPLVHLEFNDANSKYIVPASFVYPILSAFRAIIDEKTGKWEYDPVKVWNEHKVDLVDSVMAAAFKIGNPNQMGKDKSVWETCCRDLLVAKLTGALDNAKL